MTITAVDLLTQAIKNWETKGWIQGHSRNDDGATCSAGGIEFAARSQANSHRHPPGWFVLQKAFDEATLAFRNAIQDGNGRGIITWNDEPGRTVEDVILTAKRAIESLEAQR